MHAILLAALAAGAPPGWLERALADTETVPGAGPLAWSAKLPGLETAELDVRLGEELVDRIHLVRVDPGLFRFEVHHDSFLPATVEGWRERLGALVVVNGSYYDTSNRPDTPVRADGARLGPRHYRSKHGAFVAGVGAAIVDLAERDVDQVIDDFPSALVSYPLLLSHDGRVRARGSPRWLANRTFVAIDRVRRVVLGTTETGFFSLRRLGRFLKSSPLDLGAALNLDGGPVACQAVAAGGYSKVVYGGWEINDSSGTPQIYWGPEPQRWRLPIVLAVTQR